MAQGHAPGGRIHLGRQGVGANAKHSGTAGVRECTSTLSDRTLRGYRAGSASPGSSATLASESTQRYPPGSPPLARTSRRDDAPAGNGLGGGGAESCDWRPWVSPRLRAHAPSASMALCLGATSCCSMRGQPGVGGPADDGVWLRGGDAACSSRVSPLEPLPGARRHRAASARAQRVGLVRYPLRPRPIPGGRAPRARPAAAPAPPAAGPLDRGTARQPQIPPAPAAAPADASRGCPRPAAPPVGRQTASAARHNQAVDQAPPTGTAPAVLQPRR